MQLHQHLGALQHAMLGGWSRRGASLKAEKPFLLWECSRWSQAVPVDVQEANLDATWHTLMGDAWECRGGGVLQKENHCARRNCVALVSRAETREAAGEPPPAPSSSAACPEHGGGDGQIKSEITTKLINQTEEKGKFIRKVWKEGTKLTGVRDKQEIQSVGLFWKRRKQEVTPCKTPHYQTPNLTTWSVDDVKFQKRQQQKQKTVSFRWSNQKTCCWFQISRVVSPVTPRRHRFFRLGQTVNVT